MSKIIIFLTALLVTSNTYAKPPAKAGQWKEVKGSQEEIIKTLQRRMLILDKRDEVLRVATANLRKRVYYFECRYEKAC